MRAYSIPMLLAGLAAAAPGGAHPPYGLAADRNGSVFFSDLETVWRLSRDGRLSIFRPHVRETHVHALVYAPDGAVEGDQNRYDPSTGRFYSGLWRRTPDGAEQQIVPLTERPPPAMGVWRDSGGNRYTSQWLSSTDRRVILLRRTRDGRVEVLFDESGGASPPSQSSVESVGGMAFGADGSLFFGNGGVLRRLASDGKVTKIYDGGAKSSLRGLAAAADGRVLAADMGAKAVLALARNGAVSTLYREREGWLPTAVALVEGRLLVLEANADPYDRRDRVRVIEVKGGRGKVVASPGHPQAAVAAEPATDPPDETRPSWTGLLATLAACVGLLAAWRLRSLRHSNG